jgi:8-oxo-dGTP pyrophosphatase MutT (NUDIX family)
MSPRLRPTARLIVVDPSTRVLLFQYAGEGRTWWATPGGGLEGEETFEQAAIREAAEELDLAAVTLAPLWRESAEFPVRGEPVCQVEQFFLLRVSADEVVLGDNVREAHAQEDIRSTRWWSLDEIESTRELIFPEGLAARLRPLLDPRA